LGDQSSSSGATRRVSTRLRMHAMLVLQHPLGVPPPAELAPTAPALVARQGPMLIHKAGLRAEGIAVALESALMRLAVPVRRARRRFAGTDRAFVVPGHRGSGRPHDLPNALSREPDHSADSRQRFAGFVSLKHLDVAARIRCKLLGGVVPSKSRHAGMLRHPPRRVQPQSDGYCPYA
jgi:hypothetical protein